MSSLDYGKSLKSLSDVKLGNLQNGHILQYNSTLDAWQGAQLADGTSTVDPGTGGGGGGGFTEAQIYAFINSRLHDSIGNSVANFGAPDDASYLVTNTNNAIPKTIFPTENATITLIPQVITSLQGGDDLSLSMKILHNVQAYSGSPPIATVAVDYFAAGNKLIKTDTVTLDQAGSTPFSKMIDADTVRITLNYAVSTSGVSGNGTITISDIQVHDVGIIEEEIREIANEESINKLNEALAEIHKTNSNVENLQARLITADERKKLGFIDEYTQTIQVQSSTVLFGPSTETDPTNLSAAPYTIPAGTNEIVVAVPVPELENETVYIGYVDTADAVKEYEIKSTDAVSSSSTYFVYRVVLPSIKDSSTVTAHTKVDTASLVILRQIEANRQAIANIPIISQDARDVLRKISAVHVTDDEGFQSIRNAPLTNTYPVLAAEVGENPPNQVNQFPNAPLTFTRHNFYHDITVSGNKLSGVNKLIALKITQGDVGEGNNSKVLTINGISKLEIIRGVLNTYWQRGDGREETQNYIETIRTRAGTFRYTVPIGHVNNFEYNFAWHITEPKQYTVQIYASPSNPITPPQYDNAENQNELEINIPDLSQDVQLAAQNIYFHELDRPSYIVTVSYNAALGDIEVDVVQDRIYAHDYPAYFAVTAPATRTVINDSTTYPRIFDNVSTYVDNTVHNILVAFYKKANGKIAISGYINNVSIPELEYPYQEEGNFDFSNFVIGDRDGFHFVSDVQMFDIATVPTQEQLQSVYAHFDQLGLGLWEEKIEELDSIDIVANEIRTVDPTTGAARPVGEFTEFVLAMNALEDVALAPAATYDLTLTGTGYNSTLLKENIQANRSYVQLPPGYKYKVVWHIRRSTQNSAATPITTLATIQVSDVTDFAALNEALGFDSSLTAHNAIDKQSSIFSLIDLKKEAAPKYVRVQLSNPTTAAINIDVATSYLEIIQY